MILHQIHQMGDASLNDAAVQLEAIVEQPEVAFIISIIDLDIKRVQSCLTLAMMVFYFDKILKPGWPAEPACWRPVFLLPGQWYVFVHFWGKTHSSLSMSDFASRSRDLLPAPALRMRTRRRNWSGLKRHSSCFSKRFRKFIWVERAINMLCWKFHVCRLDT